MNGFLRTKPISRGSGQSAVACAAYRSGKELYDERYGKTHDYTRKEKVELIGIYVPKGSPQWMLDREKLWNAAEAKETRKDARVAREFILALPHNLSKEDQREIVRKFASHLVGQGMAVDYSLHSPGHKNDSRNFHAHFLCTTRECLPNGFGTKDKDSRSREWNKQSWLEETRTESQNIINGFLRERGLEEWKYETRTDGRAIHFGENIPKEYKENTKAMNEIRAAFLALEKEEQELKKEPVRTPEKKPESIKIQPEVPTYESVYSYLTNCTVKEWKERGATYANEIASYERKVILYHAGILKDQTFKKVSSNLKLKDNEYEDYKKLEPQIEKRGLFNKDKVIEQEKDHAIWERELNKKAQEFNSILADKKEIKGISTDAQLLDWQEKMQSKNNTWYQRVCDIKKNIEKYIDPVAGQIVKAFKDAQTYWSDRIRMEMNKDRSRDKDRGMHF